MSGEQQNPAPHPEDNPAADVLDKLWQEIILKQNPDYGDWEYPGQAFRHLKAEYVDLRMKIHVLRGALERADLLIAHLLDKGDWGRAFGLDVQLMNEVPGRVKRALTHTADSPEVEEVRQIMAELVEDTEHDQHAGGTWLHLISGSHAPDWQKGDCIILTRIITRESK